ncbi:MAG: CHAT domain-containing protein [Bacteroidota bacterium]
MWKYSILAFFIKSFLVTSIFAQKFTSDELRRRYQKADDLYNLDDANEQTDSLAIIYFDQVIDHIDTSSIENQLILWNAYIKSGVIQQYNANQRSAINHYRDAIQTVVKFNLADSMKLKPMLYTGMLYYEQENIDSSIYYLRKAELIAGTYNNVSDESQLFNTLGAIYFKLGNYSQSINYFRKAIRVMPTNSSYSESIIATCQSNIATALNKLGEYDSAISIYKPLIKQGYHSEDNYMNLGVSYFEKGDLDSALIYFHKITQPSIELYNNLADSYIQIGQIEKGLTNIEKALKLSKEGVNKKLLKAVSYNLKGEAYEKLQRYDDALRNYQRALMEAVLEFRDTSIFSNPTNKLLTTSNYQLFNFLVSKSEAFDKVYRKTGDREMLKGAMDTYEAAIKVSDFIAKYFDNDDARIFHNRIVLPTYQKAVGFVIYAFNQTKNQLLLEKALAWAEKSKANTLWISLKEEGLKLKKHLPDSLTKEESKLKYRLSQFTLKLITAQSEEEVESITNDMINTELALASVRDKFHDYQDYYDQKFSFDILDVKKLQKEVLLDDEALISYFEIDDKILLFLVKRNYLTFHEIDRSSAFKDSLNYYLKALRTISIGKSYDGRETARFLYQQLIGPVADKIKGINSLIFIPHQELNNLSFESLMSSGNKYLIETYDVRYQYAASFLPESEEIEIQLDQSISIAPFVKKSSVMQLDSVDEIKKQHMFSTLPESANEIDALSGIKLLGNNASKKEFLKILGDYKVLHLATHAYANDELPGQSFISFFPDAAEETDFKLFVHELSAIDLSGLELVFLSACETNAGKNVTGEGIMSISRAFTNAGCKNIITSLWKAEDYVTSFLSKKFYQYLEEGHSPAKALQLSKIELLRDKSYSQFRSPNYWAHLIYIGNIREAENSYWWWYIPVGIVTILLLLRIRKLMN